MRIVLFNLFHTNLSIIKIWLDIAKNHTYMIIRHPSHDRNGTNGGAEGIQTPDPLIANQVLYQLSYSPNGNDG